MDKHYLEHSKATPFFNENLSPALKERLKNLPGQEFNNSLISYKKINFSNEHVSLYILDLQQEISTDLLKDLMSNLPKGLDFSYLLFKKDKVLTVAYNNKVSTVIAEIKKVDEILAKDVLKEFHDYVVSNFIEIEIADENLWLTQSAMLQYLSSNKLHKKVYPLDFDRTNEDSIDEWFGEIEKESLPAYNDLDYTPFMINGYYVIEDVSSDTLFIYKEKDKHSGSWYRTARTYDDELDDTMGQAMYESNQYIAKAIEHHCDEFSLIAQIKDKKIIRASEDIVVLELIQNYIFNELHDQGVIFRDTPEVDLLQIIETYRALYDIWGNESNELNFFKLLNDDRLKESNKKIVFSNYCYLSPQYTAIQEVESEMAKMKDLTNFLQRQEMTFENVKNLSQHNKNEIKNYLNDHIKTLPQLSDVVKKHIFQLEEACAPGITKKFRA